MFKPFQNVLCEKKYVNNGTRVQERYTSYWLVKYYTVIKACAGLAISRAIAGNITSYR